MIDTMLTGQNRSLVRTRDRSAEILQRAARIVSEKRQQHEDRKIRIEHGIERLATFVRRVQETGIIKTLRDYPQIRVTDQSHMFSIVYRQLDYTVIVDHTTGNLMREMTFENEPGKRTRSNTFDEDRALDDLVEYVAIMIAKIQMRE